MATSSFSFDPGTIPLARDPYQVLVQRYHPQVTDLGDPPSYDFLPNVYCLGVVKKEGEPRTARFRYILSDVDFSERDYPDGFEDMIGVDATSDFVVNADDRVVVSVVSPDTGKQRLIFDGYAQEPEVAMTPSGQQVTFSAVGVEIRCYDVPIAGAAYRDANKPTDGPVTQTDLPARFNPTDTTRGLTKPNATPLFGDTGGDNNDGIGNGAYPVFLDPQIDLASEVDLDEEEDEDAALAGDTRESWTLGMVVRYLLWRPTAYGGNGDEQYVQNGDTTKLDALLQAIAPIDGGVMDPADDTTFDATDIIVRDVDVSNTAWPKALRDLIWPYGFRFRFAISGDEDGNPQTTIQFYRKDGMKGTAPKRLRLQQQGDIVDPGLSNVGSIHFNRGSVRYNRVIVETDPVLYELAVILPPMFPIAAADATVANRKKFDRSNWGIDFAGNQAARAKYRLYGYDECGDGHWDLKAGAWTTRPGGGDGLDFDAVFDFEANNKERAYARRYRPGRSDLISTEGNQPLGRRLKCQLHVSRDYAGPPSGVWDGTGTWQAVTQGWRLLRDRLGVYVTVDDPNRWDVGEPPASTPKDQVKRKGVLNAVECLATPGAATPLFYLRLTTVIPSDEGLDAVAERRPASSTSFAVAARVDARDHFRKEVIDVSSPFTPDGRKARQTTLRDDTKKAKAYIDAMRAATEQGHWAGSVTIPRFSLAYNVGDRIRGIDGRKASFQTNAGGEQGEGPTYPMIAAVSWGFDGQQSTTLEFSHASDEPPLPS